MKREVDNRANTLKSGPQEVPYIFSQICELWSIKWLIIWPQFLPTLYILFRPQSITASGINVAPHGESKWNGIWFVCSSDSKPQKDFYLAMTSSRLALSGNASLIVTVSSFYT